MIEHFGPSAKAQAILSQQLKAADYDQLLECRSEKEFFAALTKFPRYTTSAAGAAGQPSPPIGPTLERVALSLYRRLIPHCQIQVKRFLLALLQKEEIRNVKALLRARQLGFDAAQAAGLCRDLAPFSRLDCRKLAEAPSVASLVDALKKTPYRQALNDALVVQEKTGSFYPFDAALDWHYFQNLHRLSQGLDATDQQAVHRILFAQVDLYNIVNAYRARFNYRLGSDEISSFRIGCAYQLRHREFEELAAADSPDAFAAVVERTPYRALLNDAGKIEPVLLETRMNRILRAQIGKARGGLPFSLSTLLAALVLGEFEVRDLTAIGEGLRLGLAAAQIRPYLINHPGQTVWPSSN